MQVNLVQIVWWTRGRHDQLFQSASLLCVSEAVYAFPSWVMMYLRPTAVSAEVAWLSALSKVAVVPACEASYRQPEGLSWPGLPNV